MTQERRQDPRSRLAGVYATYENATGERGRAPVFDLGRGGLFLQTDKPAAVGKRLAVEIVATGEGVTWEALGRVVWTRDAEGDPDHPAGMALKLIDMDDGVSERLTSLLAARPPTARESSVAIDLRVRRATPPAPNAAGVDEGRTAAVTAPVAQAAAPAAAAVDADSPAVPKDIDDIDVPLPRRRGGAVALLMFLIAAGMAVAYAWSR